MAPYSDARREAGNLAEASLAAEQATSLCTELATSDPSNVGWQINVVSAENNLAEILSAEGQHEQAITLFDDLVTRVRRLASDQLENRELQSGFAQLLTNAGDAHVRHPSPDAARTHPLLRSLGDPRNAP